MRSRCLEQGSKLPGRSEDFGCRWRFAPDNGITFASNNAFFRLEQAIGLVVGFGGRDGAQQTGPSAAEQSQRAHASQLKKEGMRPIRPRKKTSSAAEKFDRVIES